MPGRAREQYNAAGKNTADIALALDALEAMFDQRAEFCLVTGDSDFAYLCRKLRERGAIVCVVGETKSPAALRNASDHFFEWPGGAEDEAESPSARKAPLRPAKETPRKSTPDFIVQAISLLANAAPEGKVTLGVEKAIVYKS